MKLRLPTVPEVFFWFAGFILKEKLPFQIFALKWGDLLVKFAFFSMQTYLTDVWGLSFTDAAALLNIWGAISKIFPLCSLFLADHFVGHFKMIVLSSKACAVGIVLVTMSTPLVLANSTGTCKEYEAECIGHTQKILFYTGMALVALGIGGHGASILPFFEEQHSEGRRNPFDLFLLYSIIVGFFAFPYINQWYLLFGVPGICVVCATLAFLTGWYKYEKPKAQGSPLIDVFRVFVAAARKISEPIPLDTNQLYTEYDGENNSVHLTRRFPKWLEKAAIILPDVSVEDQARNRWRLCSVEQVEAAKFVARVIPLGTAFIMCTIVSSAGNTLFVEQASHMNRKLGSWKVPSQVFLALFYYLKMHSSSIARNLVNRSGMNGWKAGIVIAMIYSVLCCVTAAKIETRRLKVVRQHGLTNEPDEAIPMHVFWLGFQFILLAGQDSYLRESIIACCKWELPGQAMDRYIGHFADALFGLGLVYSVLSVYVVGKISEIGGRQSWFQDNLNQSHLDRYYWVLAALGALNLLIFIPLACLYSSRKLPGTNDNDEQQVGDDNPSFLDLPSELITSVTTSAVISK